MMSSKLTRIMLFMLVGVSFTSCITTNKAFQSSPVNARNVELDPIKADIAVTQERIKGESTAIYFLFLRVSGDNTFADGINFNSTTPTGLNVISTWLNPTKLLSAGRLGKIRGAAAYKALNSGNYDVLVHPSYSVTVENYILVKKYTCIVEGYGGTYSNFRTEKHKLLLLENGSFISIPEEDIPTKK